MKKVVKFGGSSLATAEQFKKSLAIIKAEEGRMYVVPSAPGRRFSEDTKVTDMLLDIYELARTGKDFSALFGKVKERYEEIIAGLGLDFSLENEFKLYEENMQNDPQKDYSASRGE